MAAAGPDPTGDLASQCFVVVEGEMAQWKEGRPSAVFFLQLGDGTLRDPYSEFFFTQKWDMFAISHDISTPTSSQSLYPKSVCTDRRIQCTPPKHPWFKHLNASIGTMFPVTVKSYPASLNKSSSHSSHTSRGFKRFGLACVSGIEICSQEVFSEDLWCV